MSSSPLIPQPTTAQARIELYRYLVLLQEQILYFDTDSVIFSTAPGQNDIACGTDLGEMTDELASYGPGSYAMEFVSGGPKVYGLKIAAGGNVDNVKYILKIKGVSCNSGNADLLNYNTLKELVLGVRDPIQVESKNDIRRAKWWRIVSTDTVKTLKSVYTKRRRRGEYDTLPYGYRIV